MHSTLQSLWGCTTAHLYSKPWFTNKRALLERLILSSANGRKDAPLRKSLKNHPHLWRIIRSYGKSVRSLLAKCNVARSLFVVSKKSAIFKICSSIFLFNMEAFCDAIFWFQKDRIWEFSIDQYCVLTGPITTEAQTGFLEIPAHAAPSICCWMST